MDSLQSAAALLGESQAALQATLGTRSDVPENHALDTFFSTVKAASDVSWAAPLDADCAAHVCMYCAAAAAVLRRL